MTLKQLQYVVTVAETGNITEAAKKLFIAQPSLTAAVHELEKEYGIIFFSRSNKGIELTPDGEEILFFKWSPGEPSLVDSGDDAPENYLLLWKTDEDTWLYNDSRDDPIKEYNWIYGGVIGFVCQMW